MSCLFIKLKLGRVGMAEFYILGWVGIGWVLCGPSGPGLSWFWAELSILHLVSWLGYELTWGRFALTKNGYELTFVRVDKKPAKQHGSRSGLLIGRVWSDPKLFAKVMSRWQNRPVAGKELSLKAPLIIRSRRQIKILQYQKEQIRHDISCDSSAGRRFSWNIIPFF